MTTIIALLLTSVVLLAAAAKSPSSPPICKDELVEFSPCFPYVSAQPNNVSATVASHCCKAFVSVFESSAGYCLCYILRQPMLFGFPLEESRVLSLAFLCIRNHSRWTKDSPLASLCAEAPALPPLQSTAGSAISEPDDSGPAHAKSPLIKLPPQSVVRSPTASSSLVEPAKGSSAPNLIYSRNSCLLSGLLICPAVFLLFVMLD